MDALSIGSRELLAETIRAILAKHGVSHAEFAKAFGKSRQWVYRLLAPSGSDARGTTLAQLDALRVFLGRNYGIALSTADLFSPENVRALLEDGVRPGATRPVTGASKTDSGDHGHGAPADGDTVGVLESRLAKLESVNFDFYTALHHYFADGLRDSGDGQRAHGVEAPRPKSSSQQRRRFRKATR